MKSGVIELEHWVPDPDRPGYLQCVGTPTYRHVFDQLRGTLVAEGLVDEYFDLATRLDDAGTVLRDPAVAQPMPRGIRFVSCWAVTGGSEGHYVHIEFVVDDLETRRQRRVPFAIAKTFQGWDHAWTIAKRAAELLGA